VRFVRALSLFSLLISALSFAATTYIETDSNWRPVELPLPGPGLEVGTAFDIVTAGRFELEMEVPQGKTPSAEIPPVRCDLQLTLDGPSAFRVVRRITLLEHIGEYGFGKINLYSSPPIELPRRGAYEIRLANHGTQPVFGDLGAMVILTRYEKPTEAYLRGVLLRGTGWSALAFGLIGGVLSEISKYRRRDTETRPAA